ncbi:hypothetical protein DFH06DRAFT_1129325 [Mycena polygramma]|nr:hypothetical protein DFH06DRAFT_1129325 [Mycena polygramma]
MVGPEVDYRIQDSDRILAKQCAVVEPVDQKSKFQHSRQQPRPTAGRPTFVSQATSPLDPTRSTAREREVDGAYGCPGLEKLHVRGRAEEHVKVCVEAAQGHAAQVCEEGGCVLDVKQVEVTDAGAARQQGVPVLECAAVNSRQVRLWVDGDTGEDVCVAVEEKVVDERRDGFDPLPTTSKISRSNSGGRKGAIPAEYGGGPAAPRCWASRLKIMHDELHIIFMDPATVALARLRLDMYNNRTLVPEATYLVITSGPPAGNLTDRRAPNFPPYALCTYSARNFRDHQIKPWDNLTVRVGEGDGIVCVAIALNDVD